MIHYIISRHPFVYGIIYLILIPVYAYIYDSMPHSFYHSAAKYEERAFDEKYQILSMFEKDFKKYRGELLGRDTICQDSGVLMIEKFEASDFFIKNDFCYIMCHLTIVDPNQKLEEGLPVHVSVYPIIIKFYLLWGMRINDHRDSLSKYVAKIAVFLDKKYIKINNFRGFDLNSIGNVWLDPEHDSAPDLMTYYKFFDVNQFNDIDYMNCDNEIPKDSFRKNVVISEKLDTKIMNFNATINGYPNSDRRSNFIRMLYFSTITISTVGFGDIVPISDEARLIVASEAILGLIFIGFFLNSLASKIRNKE